MSFARKEATTLNPLIGHRPEDTSEKISAVLAFIQAQCNAEIALNKQASAGLFYICDLIHKAKRYESGELR